MKAYVRVVPGALSASFLALTLVTFVPPAGAQSDEERDAARSAAAAADLRPLAPSALRQIEAIVTQKKSRTPVQRKISSTLFFLMAKARKGLAPLAAGEGLQPLVAERVDGRVDVEILGSSTKRVVEAVEKAGGQVLYGQIKGASLRALVPLEALEGIAALPEVRGIRQTLFAVTERLRSDLRRGVDRVVIRNGGGDPTTNAAGGTIDRGDRAHRADDARLFFGLTGAGVKIGVLSDRNDVLEDSIAKGELPADMTALPGPGRPCRIGEGRRPCSRSSTTSRRGRSCLLSVPPSPDPRASPTTSGLCGPRAATSSWTTSSTSARAPFQDGEIAKAVEDVTAGGALYFSSAGNSGNANDGTSGVWEGDFKKAKSAIGALAGLGDVHDFGEGVVSDRTERTGGPIILYWSDRAGQSGNDYDLFILDDALTTVLAAASNVQDGDDEPVEALGFEVPPGFRIVILKFDGADARCASSITAESWAWRPPARSWATRPWSTRSPWPP